MRLIAHPSLAGLALALAACSSSATSDGGSPDLTVVIDLRSPADAPTTDLALPDLLPAPDLVEPVDLTDDGVGRVCGGRGGKPCAAALFCDIPIGCGYADEQGTCQEKPAVCGKNLDPVCGCDGQSYGNDCMRQQAGVSLLNHGICGCARQCGAGSHCADCFGTPQCLKNGQVC